MADGSDENDVDRVRISPNTRPTPSSEMTARFTDLGFRIGGLQTAYRLATQVASRVPADRRRVSPAAVAGPLLEAARWRTGRDPLLEMFEELLVKSCDQSTSHTANPAFVDLIRLLSPDEARILFWISQNRVVVKRGHWFKTTEHMQLRLPEHGTEVSSLEFPYWSLGNPDAFSATAYLGHLQHLGLIGYMDVERVTSGRRDVVTQNVLYTPYGSMFVSVCIPEAGFSAFAEDAVFANDTPGAP
jgi:hypothetical protein